MGTRWCCLLLFSALSLARVAAEGSPLTAEVSSGVVWGSAGELVFDPANNRKEGDPVSLLTWPVPPAFQLSLGAGWAWTPWLSTSVKIKGSWPLMTLPMTDEDWRTTTQDGFLVYGRSQSETFLTSRWSAEAEQRFQWAGFSFGLGGLYKNTQWEAWNGTARYEYLLFANEAQFSGLVLEYRQVWYIPFVSVGWTGAWDQWSVTPSVRLSPYTWCFDTDNHMFASKRVTYLDNLRGGWYAEAALELTVPIPGMTAGIRAAFETARGAVGETYAVTPSASSLGTSLTVLPSADAAGGWFQEAALSLFVRN